MSKITELGWKANAVHWQREYDALAARLAEAVAWIDRHGCGDDCHTWEPDTLNSPMLINSGPCTCGRQEILTAALTVSAADKSSPG